MNKDDKKLQEAINRLTSPVEHWLEIKKILEDEIKSNQELITFIDKIVQERQDKFSKLN